MTHTDVEACGFIESKMLSCAWVAGINPTGFENDGWAMGLCMYEMAAGRHLFQDLPGICVPLMKTRPSVAV